MFCRARLKIIYIQYICFWFLLVPLQCHVVESCTKIIKNMCARWPGTKMRYTISTIQKLRVHWIFDNIIRHDHLEKYFLIFVYSTAHCIFSKITLFAHFPIVFFFKQRRPLYRARRWHCSYNLYNVKRK